MRQLRYSIGLLILVFFAACAPTTAPENDLEDTLSEFAAAFQSGDYDTVASSIAENYLHVNSDASPIDRTQWLDWYKGYAQEINNGDHVFEHYDIEDVQIVVHNEAAYVTGVVHASGIRFGEAFSQNIRFTNLWVVEQQHWKRAGFHDVAVSSDD